MQHKDQRKPTAGGASSISSLTSQLAAIPPGRAVDTINTSNERKDDLDKKQKNNATNTPGELPSPSSLSAPFTPRRLSFSNRLSLQMPSRGPLPLSPVLDPALGYSVARRPRLDFARACTSLHHSTLAESSPDSSPLASNTGYPIPRNNHVRPLESPISTNYHNPGSSHASSLGSASMLDYAPSGDDCDSSSDDDDIDIELDVTTPSTAVNLQMESAASLSLLDHRKARLSHKTWRRHNHSYSNGSNSFISPSPTLRATLMNGVLDGPQFDIPMRRDSISLGPAALDIGSEPIRLDPVRRPVSRRGSLLPKTKNFARIKAALIEESSPIDVEVKREAEITRQIREDEEENPSPPSLQEGRQIDNELTDINEEDGVSSGASSQIGNRGIGISFSKQAQKHGGFWFGDQMDGIGGSPPTFPTRLGSDGDIIMNSDSVVNSPVGGIPAEMRRAKRRRTQDELFEPSVFKRRAVSPGLSNSPIMAQSPPTGSISGGRRLNFQGLSDTNDGLMKMSLQ
ncbi:hypothetical protein EDC01DRAFT_674037 [Geopyxis carbonaria]|nr:hypothetical protein EDC01DRAFT_674037 [Geopyxis carbonaria]